MNSTLQTTLVFGLFALWQLVALFFFFSNERKLSFTKRGVFFFLACGCLLAMLRSRAYWSLDYQLRHHTVDGTKDLLQWLVLPETFLVGQFLLGENIELWLTAVYATLIAGSFLWAFPLLLFTARRKTFL